MSESQLVTVVDEFGLRRLYQGNRVFSGPGQAHSGPFWDVNEKRPDVVKGPHSASDADVDVESPVGSCEFVGRLVDDTVDGRFCFNGCFCPSRVYANAAVYVSCPDRAEKLKAEKEQG